MQGLQISNQSAIYSLRPEARSRLTTAYMVAYFAGGASLSAAAAALYGSDGWAGVCVLGAVTAAVALAAWAGDRAALVGGRAARYGHRARLARHRASAPDAGHAGL